MLDDWLELEGACALVEESDGWRLFWARFFLLSLLGVVVADCEDWLDDAGAWALVDEEEDDGAWALGEDGWLWEPLWLELVPDDDDGAAWLEGAELLGWLARCLFN